MKRRNATIASLAIATLAAMARDEVDILQGLETPPRGLKMKTPHEEVFGEITPNRKERRKQKSMMRRR